MRPVVDMNLFPIKEEEREVIGEWEVNFVPHIHMRWLKVNHNTMLENTIEHARNLGGIESKGIGDPMNSDAWYIVERIFQVMRYTN